MSATASVTAWCACGASLSVQSTDRTAVDDIASLFYHLHQGPGHEPATAHQARLARRRDAHARRSLERTMR